MIFYIVNTDCCLYSGYVCVEGYGIKNELLHALGKYITRKLASQSLGFVLLRGFTWIPFTLDFFTNMCMEIYFKTNKNGFYRYWYIIFRNRIKQCKLSIEYRSTLVNQ